VTGQGEPEPDGGQRSPVDRLQKGRRMQDRLDPGHADALSAALADVAPDFSRLTTEIAFGDVYGRPGLDVRSRQIATVAALVTLGERTQLQTHLRFALNIGISRDELVEVIIQLAIYAGWPRAVNALYAARDVFAELDAGQARANPGP
jgi:4-carboxymuconolactone decarboxylase